MCTALQGTQEVKDYPSFCRMRQLGVLLLQGVPKRPGVIVVFVEVAGGITTSQGTKKVRRYPSF